MVNNSFDKHIKQLLNQLDGGEPLDSWDALNDKLDANLEPTSTEDLGFDENIKNSIVDYSVVEMADWENFLPGLLLDENLVDLDAEINIDNGVKENLNTLQPEYDPSSWDALAHKLDLSVADGHEHVDAALDQAAYDKLLNYTVPQRAGDWKSFEKELDKEFIIPYILLFKYKLAEVAILASLILIFFQVKPIIKNHNESKAAIAQEKILSTTSDLSTASVSATKTEISNKTPISPKAELKNNRLAESTITTSQKANDDDNDTRSAIRLTETNQVSNTSQSSQLQNKQVQSTYPHIHNSNVDNSVINVPNVLTPVINAKDEQSIKEDNKQFVVAQNNETSRGIGQQLNVSKLPTEALVSLDFDDSKGVQFCKSCYNVGSLLRWRLGAKIDVKYNYIMTGYDNIFNLESYNHSTLSYGAGLSTSLLLGNWELESGFDYSSREYSPQTKSEFLGSISKGFVIIQLDKIQMDILSIPLNLRYHFKDRSAKTHFYLHAGATLSVATQTSHRITSDFLNSGKRPSLEENRQFVEESNTSSDKIYSAGWFEGGSYLENKYYTTNLGLGFERKVSARYSFFGQTTYSHFLDRRGLGPNEDRFNTLNFSAGIRALFK